MFPLAESAFDFGFYLKYCHRRLGLLIKSFGEIVG